MKTPTGFEMRKISELIPYAQNAKTHPPEQIEALRRSMARFGFVAPVGIDGQGNVIFGHGRLLAAQAEGETMAPCVIVEHLDETERAAYVLADNRLSELGGWDEDLVRSQTQALAAAGFDITITGFTLQALRGVSAKDVVEDEAPLAWPENPVSKPGTLWQLGRHRLLCGDATSVNDVQMLLGGVQQTFSSRTLRMSSTTPLPAGA